MSLQSEYYESLYHHGVKGMKWGRRRYENYDGTLTPEGKMRYNDSDTAVTKQVKKDYNDLSDRDFSRKYQTTKAVYAKRVNKYGDPYENNPVVQRAKKIDEKRLNKSAQKNEAKINALNKDIDSFKGHENGIFTKNGVMLLSPDDVKKSVSELTSKRDKYQKEVNDMIGRFSNDYQVTYDGANNKYKLELKR